MHAHVVTEWRCSSAISIINEQMVVGQARSNGNVATVATCRAWQAQASEQRVGAIYACTCAYVYMYVYIYMYM
jgi:hypothetical protein